MSLYVAVRDVVSQHMRVEQPEYEATMGDFPYAVITFEGATVRETGEVQPILLVTFCIGAPKTKDIQEEMFDVVMPILQALNDARGMKVGSIGNTIIQPIDEGRFNVLTLPVEVVKPSTRV